MHSIIPPQQGITALDLLVSMAIAAILVALGVPAFENYGLEQRMKAAVSSLHSDLALARNEAIGLNARVVACPADASGNCADLANWHAGWLVFLDSNDDREWQNTEVLLRRADPLKAVRITSSINRKRLRFFPNGTAPGSNASITFCDARGTASARQIVLSGSGRIRRKAPSETDTANCNG
jgi:type IV fimbrial biogenesis protein FimT